MARSPNDIVQSDSSHVSVEDVRSIWTDEAMANAKPIPFEIVKRPARVPSSKKKAAAGLLTYREATAPGDAAISSWATQPAPGNNVSNTQLVTNRNITPYCAVGKMYMQFDGNNYVATGWVIGESLVFTAGHCVYNRNAANPWAQNILFVPKYDNGSAPIGNWVAINRSTLNGWISGGSNAYLYDMGCFKTHQPIRPSTGSLGWIANASPSLSPVTSIGYPAASPFNGQQMWQSIGAYVGGTNPISAYNSMTPGCSGGPWETWDRGLPLTSGVNSFRYTNDPSTLYSPYFDDKFLGLREFCIGPHDGLSLEVLVHLQDIGDAYWCEAQWAGTSTQSRRLEGFQITGFPPIPNLSWQYMAHLEGTGDTAWVPAGQFVGTRAQSRRLEGFAIQLTGSEASNYKVEYRAHLQNIGNTGYFSNGAFCGTRGESRRVEAIFVRIVHI